MFLDIKINRYRQQPIHLIPRPTNDNNNKKNPTFHIMYIEIQIQYIFTQFNIPRTHRQYIVLYNFFSYPPLSILSWGKFIYLDIYLFCRQQCWACCCYCWYRKCYAFFLTLLYSCHHHDPSHHLILHTQYVLISSSLLYLYVQRWMMIEPLLLSYRQQNGIICVV